MNIVTSFSAHGYRVYGKRFVETFLEHWPAHCHLHVFHESESHHSEFPTVSWHNLHDDVAHEAFCHRYHGREYNDPIDFNAQTIRFCHKVFAITSPVLPVDSNWRVWIDSDVVTTKPVAESLLAQVLPPAVSLTYLGRDPALNPKWMFGSKWRPICSETGFVGYNLDDKNVRALLDDMRRFYTSGEIVTRPPTDWHDAKCFDVCRERSEVDADKLLNYSRGIAGTDVWPKTVLGTFMAHHKGPGRKMKAYGRNA